MVGNSSPSADPGPGDALDDRAASAPWRRRAVLAPVVAVVVLFVAGFVVANLPGRGMHPFASLFVGITWSLATLIVVTAVVVYGTTRLLRFVRQVG